MKDTYTKALLDLLTTEADAAQVLAGFKQTLTQRGHSALYGPVLRRVLRMLTAARPQTVVTICDTTARQDLADAISAALSELGAPSDMEPAVVIDETIVGGFIVEHGHQRQDSSYKSKLVSLYRSITN